MAGAHIFNSCIQKAEAGGSLRVEASLEFRTARIIQRDSVSKKQSKTNKNPRTNKPHTHIHTPYIPHHTYIHTYHIQTHTDTQSNNAFSLRLTGVVVVLDSSTMELSLLWSLDQMSSWCLLLGPSGAGTSPTWGPFPAQPAWEDPVPKSYLLRWSSPACPWGEDKDTERQRCPVSWVDRACSQQTSHLHRFTGSAL